MDAFQLANLRLGRGDRAQSASGRPWRCWCWYALIAFGGGISTVSAIGLCSRDCCNKPTVAWNLS